MKHDMADATSAHASGDLTPASSMLSRILLALLLLPCIASALSLRTRNTEPALKVTGDRPALVFESYLADSSHLTAESKPVISEEFYFRNQGQSRHEKFLRGKPAGSRCPSVQPMNPPAYGNTC
jgi:hypothetical protein